MNSIHTSTPQDFFNNTVWEKVTEQCVAMAPAHTQTSCPLQQHQTGHGVGRWTGEVLELCSLSAAPLRYVFRAVLGSLGLLPCSDSRKCSWLGEALSGCVCPVLYQGGGGYREALGGSSSCPGKHASMLTCLSAVLNPMKWITESNDPMDPLLTDIWLQISSQCLGVINKGLAILFGANFQKLNS